MPRGRDRPALITTPRPGIEFPPGCLIMDDDDTQVHDDQPFHAGIPLTKSRIVRFHNCRAYLRQGRDGPYNEFHESGSLTSDTDISVKRMLAGRAVYPAHCQIRRSSVTVTPVAFAHRPRHRPQDSFSCIRLRSSPAMSAPSATTEANAHWSLYSTVPHLPAPRHRTRSLR